MNCRFCGKELCLPFLNLGSAPPSNSYLDEASLLSPEMWYPLRLLVCDSCWLVQTEDYGGRDIFFSDNYAYFSSYSTSWLDHVSQYVKMVIDRFGLDLSSRIVEIASNDGYLLQYVQAAGIPCYGVEPTASTARVAKAKGLDIVEKFFGTDLANELSAAGRQADVIVANNVLAHVPDINDFVAGFPRLLKANGVATFEFPHLLRMVQENQFDTAYHEHYSYLSFSTVENIFAQNGLTVFDVQELPTHGGSLRVFAQRSDGGTLPASEEVAALRKREADLGMQSYSFYGDFQTKAEKVKDDLVAFLIESKRRGLRVGAYGAAAKGNTLLNFAGVRPDLLPYVVDRNPAKQGRFMPGNRIPIVSEEHLKEHMPDLALILPWNLRNEVMRQLEYVRAWGGRFVCAVPSLSVTPGVRP